MFFDYNDLANIIKKVVFMLNDLLNGINKEVKEVQDIINDNNLSNKDKVIGVAVSSSASLLDGAASELSMASKYIRQLSGKAEQTPMQHLVREIEEQNQLDISTQNSEDVENKN